ncbi:MAG: hypothetical protein GC159_10945 [Phycisphaera sp.]|nr:hypothetical protein [Phycisphaera sp.]
MAGAMSGRPSSTSGEALQWILMGKTPRKRRGKTSGKTSGSDRSSKPSDPAIECNTVFSEVITHGRLPEGLDHEPRPWTVVDDRGERTFQIRSIPDGCMPKLRGLLLGSEAALGLRLKSGADVFWFIRRCVSGGLLQGGVRCHDLRHALLRIGAGQFDVIIDEDAAENSTEETSDVATDLPPLNDTDRKVARFILDRGPVTGNAIATEVRKSEQHIRGNIVPKLKRYGLINPGNHDGYQFPAGAAIRRLLNDPPSQ